MRWRPITENNRTQEPKDNTQIQNKRKSQAPGPVAGPAGATKEPRANWVLGFGAWATMPRPPIGKP